MMKNKDMLQFNINDTIYVKLNDLGCQHLADKHNEYLGKIPNWDYRDAEYYKGKANEDGYTSFQLWGFINKFGENTYLGARMMYSADILIGKQNLTKYENNR